MDSCINRGAVGYPHYGYNVGGIAGRQSGHITSCTNMGEIYGRKDVAGIVGQMEPYLKLLASASLADQLERTLQAMISNLVANAGYLGDEVRNALSSISSTAGQTIEDIIYNDWGSLWPQPTPGTGGTDPGTGGTDPGTGGTDPGTGGTDPGTGSTDSGTDGTESGAGTTEPGTEPGDGQTDGTQMQAEPAPVQEDGILEAAPESVPAAETLADTGLSGGIVLLSALEPGAGTDGTDPGTGGDTDPGTGDSGGLLPVPSIDSETLKENLDKMAADAQYFNSMLGATADSVKNDLSAVSYQLSKVLIMMANTLAVRKR